MISYCSSITACFCKNNFKRIWLVNCFGKKLVKHCICVRKYFCIWSEMNQYPEFLKLNNSSFSTIMPNHTKSCTDSVVFPCEPISCLAERFFIAGEEDFIRLKNESQNQKYLIISLFTLYFCYQGNDWWICSTFQRPRSSALQWKTKPYLCWLARISMKWNGLGKRIIQPDSGKAAKDLAVF